MSQPYHAAIALSSPILSNNPHRSRPTRNPMPTRRSVTLLHHCNPRNHKPRLRRPNPRRTMNPVTVGIHAVVIPHYRAAIRRRERLASPYRRTSFFFLTPYGASPVPCAPASEPALRHERSLHVRRFRGTVREGGRRGLAALAGAIFALAARAAHAQVDENENPPVPPPPPPEDRRPGAWNRV